MKRYQKKDGLDCEFIRIPKPILKEDAYRTLSSDAKLTYALLYDRLSLSMENGWVNAQGEVFLLFTREEIANALGISYKKAMGAFRELTRAELIAEQRMGRGFPNKIYLTKLPYEQNKNIPKSRSLSSQKEDQDLPKVPTNHTEKNQTKKNQTEISQSVCSVKEEEDRRADRLYHLEEILAQCHLERFSKEEQTILYDALERMFYSDGLRVGRAILPKDKVRSRMYQLNESILEGVMISLHQNQKPIKNLTAYVISTIFNAIAEEASILHLDPYLNSLRKDKKKDDTAGYRPWENNP